MIATLRFNHLNPPFNNPAIRRAMLGAIEQADYMIGMVGTDETLWRDKVGFFCPGTPLANDAGMQVLTGRRDLAGEARHRGCRLNGRKGRRADADRHPLGPGVGRNHRRHAAAGRHERRTPAMDWATLVQRRAKTEPVEQGGWSIFHTCWSGLDMVNPAGHVFLRGNGRAAAPGWPASPRIEGLRDAWFGAPDLPRRRRWPRSCNSRRSRTCPTSRSARLQADRLPGESDRDAEGNPVFWNFRANLRWKDKDSMSDFELVWDLALRRRGIAGVGCGQAPAAVL